MSKYKLLALDMDGTVLNDQLAISDENVHWINKARESGIIVMFSTGRGIGKAIDYVDQLGLDAPLITVNGSEIWSKPYELLQRTLLDHSLVQKMYELYKKHPEVWFWAYTTENIYNKENWATITKPLDQYDWLKFGYYVEDLELINSIRAEIEAWGQLEISNSSPYNIELNAYGVSKASALEKLCQHLNIEMCEVIAMGDSLNDIKAIMQCGLGVAMGNAQDEVKAVADYVTVNNNEHAVADVIKKYIISE